MELIYFSDVQGKLMPSSGGLSASAADYDA